MSSKIGLLFSLVFFTMFFLLAVDVMCIQYHYSDLDNKSIVVGYELAHLVVISDDEINKIEDEYHLVVMSISTREPNFGDVITYSVSRNYKPIIVSKEAMVLKVNRSVVVGYN